MIVSRITDGLGNQMFQYALGRSLSVSHSEKLFLDISWFNETEQRFTSRSYGLDRFNINAKIINNNSVLKFTTPQLPIGIRSIYYRFQNVLPYYKRKIYKEQAFCYDPRVFTGSSNVYLYGFWQSYKYFDRIRGLLIDDFSLNDPSESFMRWEAKVKNGVSVSLHIRRGDYCNRQQNHEHALLDFDYYSKALNFCNKKIGEDFNIYVFSDDIEWSKKHFSGENLCFVTGITAPEEELMLMSTCTHNIIANSTFSWWGAWLNQNKDKIVIGPKYWFTIDNKSTIDLIPNSWNLL